MSTFKVTYPDGSEKVETQSDCHTVDQFINCRFGSSSGEGFKVEEVGEDGKPVTKAKAKK